MKYKDLVLKGYMDFYNIKDSIFVSVNPRLKELHFKIKKHLARQRKEWKHPSYPYYQAYKKIALSGLRITEERIKEYEINQYLNKDDLILDIGCNTGFISLELNKYVKSIDALDKNPYLIMIANDVKDFLLIKNVNFHAKAFEDYKAKKKYNIIFSFSSHESWDGNSIFNLKQYIEKINNLLVSSGMLFFETHDIDTEDIVYIIEVIEKFFTIRLQKYIHSSNNLMPNRVFFILDKK